MSIANPPKIYTVEEFLALPDHDRFELVEGELVEVHVSNLSARVAVRLATRIDSYCEGKSLGETFGSDAYFQCFPRRPKHARKPDVSFISQARLPEHWMADGIFIIAPDLAVEVLSPNDLAYEVDEKIVEYREAGVRLIWIINPEQRIVHILRADGTGGTLDESGTLSGEDVIPGFSCGVGELFPKR